MNDSRFFGVQSRRVHLVMRRHLFAEGLRTILQQNPSKCLSIQGQNTRLSDFINSPKSQQKTDILLLELYSTLDWSLLTQWADRHPEAKIIGLGAKQDENLVEKAKMIGLDACLVMEEPTEQFLKKLDMALNGHFEWPAKTRIKKQIKSPNDTQSFIHKYKLTRREMQILKLISKALTTKEIAGNLYISDQTVSVHRKNIMRKLGVNNTAAVVRIAMEYHVLS